MDWIDLALDRIQRRASVNTVMNIRISYNVEKFLSGWPLLNKGSAPWYAPKMGGNFFLWLVRTPDLLPFRINVKL
jgi:hypothetical protein